MIHLGHAGRSRSRAWRRAVSTFATCLAVGAIASAAGAGQTIRASVGNGGSQANGESTAHVFGGLNSSGTVIAFTSEADDLVAADTNDANDFFVRDLKSGATTRVSVASDGTQGDGLSGFGTISGNGRYVAFLSAATNLVANDTNGVRDVFFHDRDTAQTSRVSVNSAGIQGNNESGGSGFLAVTPNGRSVVFSSGADNLVAGDTNAAEDVFSHDVKKQVTQRISLAADGGEANNASFYPAPSASGGRVAFVSLASNLVPNDSNGFVDIFLRDVRKATTIRVNVASDGSEANGGSGSPAISVNGRMVAFVSKATNLVSDDTNGVVDAFVHDTKTGQTTRISVASDGAQANGVSGTVAISGNGRFVIFQSAATNLVAADTNAADDVFVHDLKTHQTVRVNVDGAGVQSTGSLGFDLALSRNGRFAAFSTDAAALVTNDTNGFADVFIHDLKP